MNLEDISYEVITMFESLIYLRNKRESSDRSKNKPFVLKSKYFRIDSLLLIEFLLIVVYLHEVSEIKLENIHSNFVLNSLYYSKIIPTMITIEFINMI